MEKNYYPENKRFIAALEALKETGEIRSQKDLAQKVEEPAQTITDVKSHKKRVQLNFLGRVAEKTRINKEYVLFGTGPALGQSKTISVQLKPHIPVESMAEKLSEYWELIQEKDCTFYPRIAGFGDYDFTLTVSGDSMMDKYFPGDIIACRFIKDSKFIQWGRVHVLDTSQGVMVKVLMPHENTDILKAMSFNPKYPPLDIPKNEISAIAIVLGFTRKD